MVGTEVIIKESAMSWDLQQDCVDCTAHAFNVLKLNDQTAIAQFIKKELDAKYGNRWHCVVGHSFGSLVGHDVENFLYLLVKDVYVMIWRMNTDYEQKKVSVRTLGATQDAKRAAMPEY